MALTDLTGTTWRLNSTIVSWPDGNTDIREIPSGSYNVFSVNYTIKPSAADFAYWGDDYFDCSDMYAEGISGYYVLDFNVSKSGERSSGSSYATPWSMDFEMFEVFYFTTTGNFPVNYSTAFSGTFTFAGGRDATNPDLIAWLEDNATLVYPEGVTIKYDGSVIAYMSVNDTKILETAGKLCTDNIEVHYVKPSETVPVVRAYMIDSGEVDPVNLAHWSGEFSETIPSSSFTVRKACVLNDLVISTGSMHIYNNIALNPSDLLTTVSISPQEELTIEGSELLDGTAISGIELNFYDNEYPVEVQGISELIYAVY